MASTEAAPTDTDVLLSPADQTAESNHAPEATPTRPRAHVTAKRRMDTNKDAMPSDSSPTKQQLSDSDLMEESLEEDNDEGSTLVEHRRKRTTGIPVLLTPTQEVGGLQLLNPLKLSDEIKAAAGAPFIRDRFAAKGGLLVDAEEPAAVNRLLNVRSLGGTSVMGTIPKAYMQNNGLIKGVPDWHSNSDLTELFNPLESLQLAVSISGMASLSKQLNQRTEG